LALAALLLVGLGVRTVAVLSGALLLVFIVGIASVWARGLTIDCGCFGGGGQTDAAHTRYLQEILRDTGFLVPAVWLVVRPRSQFSLDDQFVPTLSSPRPLSSVGGAPGRAPADRTGPRSGLPPQE
jgi:uncharacterized membrane protein YphA (DoxX/SURF4 family)